MLLCILAFILFLLCVVLFAPIRYKLTVDTDDGFDFKKIRLEVIVSWMLFIRGRFTLENGSFLMSLKVFFFELMKKKDKKEVTNDAELSVDTETPQENVAKDDVEVKNDEINVEESGTEESHIEEPESEETHIEETSEDKADNDIPDIEPTSTDANADKTKKEIHWLHISEIYAMIVDKVLEFFDFVEKKIQYAKKNIRNILAIINDIDNRKFVIMVLKELKSLLKHIWIRKHKFYIKLGMEDPSLTGEILGAYSVVNSILRMNVALEPDFNNKVLVIKGMAKGHIRLIHVLIIVIKVGTNKVFWKFIRRK